MSETDTPARHPTHQLFAALQNLGSYPDGVLAVPEQIQGTCFFPGGTGLWHGLAETIPEFPVGGVMVLGHDFHSVLGYERSRLGGSENLRWPTWRQLVEFLARVPIALEQALVPPASFRARRRRCLCRLAGSFCFSKLPSSSPR